MLKIGYIGMGNRGTYVLGNILDCFKDRVEIAAICDVYEDRVQHGIDMVKEKTGKAPVGTTNSDDVMKMDVDAVMIMAAWEAHIPLAIDAMKAGKLVGMEVAGAYSIDDCYRLVHTSEETGIGCMLLENCCYGKTELAVLNMVREGLFGEIVHCDGGYCHDLRTEVAIGPITKHYRNRNYYSRNGENYPTHELGPIAKVLNINRGNRMVSLVSVASKARGLKEYADAHGKVLRNKLAKGETTVSYYGRDYDYNEDVYNEYVKANSREVKQGDIVNTIITCADGSTITLTLDTTLPRAYSRGFTVKGTKGMYMEDNNSVYIDGDAEMEKAHFSWQKYWDNGKEFEEKYRHSVWQKYGEAAATSGHDGMDYMVLSAFFEALEKKKPFPIDVYDAAAWMSITCLSEESIAHGGMPVAIPDFTGGKWAMYKKEDHGLEFALD